MRKHFCDLTGSQLIEPEVSTLRITGPAASVLRTREIHLGKEGAYDLAEFLGIVVARPEGLGETMAARRKADEDLDRDPTAFDLMGKPHPAGKRPKPKRS